MRLANNAYSVHFHCATQFSFHKFHSLHFHTHFLSLFIFISFMSMFITMQSIFLYAQQLHSRHIIFLKPRNQNANWPFNGISISSKQILKKAFICISCDASQPATSKKSIFILLGGIWQQQFQFGFNIFSCIAFYGTWFFAGFQVVVVAVRVFHRVCGELYGYFAITIHEPYKWLYNQGE